MAKVKKRILDYLAARPQEKAFLRSEFDGLAKSRSGVDKAVRALINEGLLVRGGWGVLVRAQMGRIVKGPVPVCGVAEFGFEALRKLGIDPQDDPEFVKARQAYNARQTTQVPIGGFTLVGKSRITRRIGFNKNTLRFARDVSKDAR